MKSRPFGVTLLAILSVIAAVVAVFHTLQMLHLLPVWLGPLRFFTLNILGAILWGLLALIYLWVARMLWNLDPQGWLFVTVLSTLNLVLDLVSWLGGTPWQALLPSVLINGIILIYANLPGVRRAFGAPGK